MAAYPKDVTAKGKIVGCPVMLTKLSDFVVNVCFLLISVSKRVLAPEGFIGIFVTEGGGGMNRA
jgi:hypothetical protein